MRNMLCVNQPKKLAEPFVVSLENAKKAMHKAWLFSVQISLYFYGQIPFLSSIIIEDLQNRRKTKIPSTKVILWLFYLFSCFIYFAGNKIRTFVPSPILL